MSSNNRNNKRHIRVSGSMAAAYLPKFEWAPNWIDHRASLSRAYDRPDAPLCPGCECELDVSPIPHSPRCSVNPVVPKPKSGTHKLASEAAKARVREKRAKARA